MGFSALGGDRRSAVIMVARASAPSEAETLRASYRRILHASAHARLSCSRVGRRVRLSIARPPRQDCGLRGRGTLGCRRERARLASTHILEARAGCPPGFSAQPGTSSTHVRLISTGQATCRGRKSRLVARNSEPVLRGETLDRLRTAGRRRASRTSSTAAASQMLVGAQVRIGPMATPGTLREVRDGASLPMLFEAPRAQLRGRPRSGSVAAIADHLQCPLARCAIQHCQG